MLPDANRYWDSVAGRWQEDRPQKLWRAYCDTLNGKLIRRFLAGRQVGQALKTDLFDEAMSDSGLVPYLADTARSVVGIDLSHLTTHLAQTHHIELQTCTADARSLPFVDDTFDIVLSNSTLDHFNSANDIETALGEIARVLRSEGRLLLTLDNLANPVIALRSVLPHHLLNRLGLVPYFTGETCGPGRLRELIERAGLTTSYIGAMMHCPRVPAVAAANLLDHFGQTRFTNGFVRFLMGWESLEALPTCYLSGYFITVLAERPSR